ncbi:hypothetical protein ATY41_05205 [Leifsonia xyli subsp. xyli]|uniref:Transposase n=1 Tax=Leifsonia xyli subsp. xyli TaxID=59736 RepID=A0A1E2SIB3_LEIXY|nr:hypothetical protein [Leifsonia xyli]ODA89489.1 hypothetical protein ATY41_05205 [Leifsonia xyli subsp. xyli]
MGGAPVRVPVAVVLRVLGLCRQGRYQWLEDPVSPRDGDCRTDLRLTIVPWTETKYNRRRQQRDLGKLSPVEFEMIYKDPEAI